MHDSQPSAGLIDRAGEILDLVKALAKAIDERDRGGADDAVARAEAAWRALYPVLVNVGASLSPQSDPVSDWIREVGKAAGWLNQKAREQGLAAVLFRFNCESFERLASEGAAILKQLAAQPDPFAFADRATGRASFTQMNRFPPTPEGHIAFLEWVRDEVHNVVGMKGRYEWETIAKTITGIYWAEARRRALALSVRPEAVWRDLFEIVNRTLESGTVEQIDDLLTEALRRARDCLERDRLPGVPAKPTNRKRSTESGEGQTKLIAALTKHHQYAKGSSLNATPIGSNELARLAGVSDSTASQFFKAKFGGHRKYRAACQDLTLLIASLKTLNQEFTPREFFRTTFGEGQRDDD